MGIGKSKNTPSINVDDMFKTAEISQETEFEKQDFDKRLAEVREAKEALQKIHQDLQDKIRISNPTSTAFRPSCRSMEDRVGESPF